MYIYVYWDVGIPGHNPRAQKMTDESFVSLLPRATMDRNRALCRNGVCLQRSVRLAGCPFPRKCLTSRLHWYLPPTQGSLTTVGAIFVVTCCWYGRVNPELTCYRHLATLYPIPLFQPFHNGYLLVIFSNYLRRLYVAHATAGAIAYSRILPRHHKLIPIFRAHLPAQSSMLTFQQFSRCGNHFTVFGSCRQNVFSQCQSRSNDQLHPCCSIASNHTTRDVRIDRLLQCLRLIRCLECFYQDYDIHGGHFEKGTWMQSTCPGCNQWLLKATSAGHPSDQSRSAADVLNRAGQFTVLTSSLCRTGTRAWWSGLCLKADDTTQDVSKPYFWYRSIGDIQEARIDYIAKSFGSVGSNAHPKRQYDWHLSLSVRESTHTLFLSVCQQRYHYSRFGLSDDKWTRTCVSWIASIQRTSRGID